MRPLIYKIFVMSPLLKLFLCILLIAVIPVSSKTWLRASGKSGDTYKLLNSVLGGTAYEVPDCAHSSFGPHITQVSDKALGRPVFAFHIHVKPDNDECSKFDRQRVEIKTYSPSPPELKGFSGDTVTLSWNFKLDSRFQPSSKFTHIHQIKAVGGSDKDTPIITITPRVRKGASILEVIHVGRGGKKTVLKTEDFGKFAGKWIHASEELTYGKNGKYKLVLEEVGGKEVMSVTNNKIDLWRDGAEFVRPKWGIYRSLQEPKAIQDEVVLFDSFCIGKGTSDKCT